LTLFVDVPRKFHRSSDGVGGISFNCTLPLDHCSYLAALGKVSVGPKRVVVIDNRARPELPQRRGWFGGRNMYKPNQ
jgi:hypothetical protein